MILKKVLEHRFGKTGYSFVIDTSGKAVIHPKLEGANVLNYKGLSNAYLQMVLDQKKERYSIHGKIQMKTSQGRKW